MVKHLTTFVILFMLRIFPHMVFALILKVCWYHHPENKEGTCDRAFTVAATSLWNKLPSAIRDEDEHCLYHE